MEANSAMQKVAAEPAYDPKAKKSQFLREAGIQSKIFKLEYEQLQGSERTRISSRSNPSKKDLRVKPHLCPCRQTNM